MFDNIIHKYERLLSKLLIVVALLFITMETIDLVVKLVEAIIHFDFQASLNEEHYKPFTGFVVVFFNVLIGLELIETLRVEEVSYSEKAKLILLICLIAVSRKLLSMNLKYTDFETNLSVAAIILSLTLGYFFLHHHKQKDKIVPKEEQK